ncbi:putative WRKY transcription factor 35 [Wolffia australiana]
MESTPLEHGELQISSLSPGSPDCIRKSHTKRVVCIPALEAGSGKPGGDVIPPDLWAWRKYGQKPIKGSPYPRGYYRCSSSKQCSARKQVEKSRSDPRMLVITYTSEHNHPWPTQKMSTVVCSRSPLPRSEASKTGVLSFSQLSTTREGITKDDKREKDDSTSIRPSTGETGWCL